MEVASGSSTRRRNSGRRFYICGFLASITQGWTDRNPCRRFYGCPRFPNGFNYFSWFDEEDGTAWQKQALLDARDEIREKTRVIEQLTQTISEMKSNFETKRQWMTKMKMRLLESLKNSIFKCFGLSELV